jgi:glycine/D-amino acid oxidase-like deaminating enzyme
MWPYKFILHLLKSSIATGRLNLQTHTPVTAISSTPEGGYIVQTPRGAIHAKKVIHANNAYVAGLLPEYKKNIIPCKGICCRITVPEGKIAPLVDNSYIIRTTDGKGLDYLIPRADGSIIVGGASQTFRPTREHWYNNIDDSVLIEPTKDYYVNYMQRTFRGWDATDAKVDKIWTGGQYSFLFLF